MFVLELKHPTLFSRTTQNYALPAAPSAGPLDRDPIAVGAVDLIKQTLTNKSRVKRRLEPTYSKGGVPVFTFAGSGSSTAAAQVLTVPPLLPIWWPWLLCLVLLLLDFFYHVMRESICLRLYIYMGTDENVCVHRILNRSAVTTLKGGATC